MSKVPWFSDFGVLAADITLPKVPTSHRSLLGAVFLAARQTGPLWVRVHSELSLRSDIKKTPKMR